MHNKGQEGSETTLRELWRKLELFVEKLWRMQYDLLASEIEEMEENVTSNGSV